MNLKNNKTNNNNSLILKESTALARATNQIVTTNKLLAKINKISPIDWWNGLDEKWKKIFIMNLHLSKLNIQIEYTYGLESWYMSVFEKIPPFDFSLSQKDIEDIVRKKKVSLSHCKLNNIQPLGMLSKIEELDITQNSISDLRPLSDLRSLRNLDCSWNPIYDFSPLNNLLNLKTLDICGRELDLEDIIHLKNSLEFLTTDSRIINFQLISQFKLIKSLKSLSADIKDLTSIKDNYQLEGLWIFNNIVSSIEPLSNLNNITHLCIDDNIIDDLTPLKNLNNLIELDCSYNMIFSLRSLSNLKNLKKLICTGNFIPSYKLNYFRTAHPDCTVKSEYQNEFNSNWNEGRKILLIQDDISLNIEFINKISAYLASQLAIKDFEILVATKLESALEYLSEFRFNVAFINPNLYDFDIDEHSQLFNEIDFHTTFRVIISDKIASPSISSYIINGNDQFLQIPFNSNELKAVLKKTLRLVTEEINL